MLVKLNYIDKNLNKKVTIDDNSSMSNLYSRIEEEFNLSPCEYDVLVGYPLKIISGLDIDLVKSIGVENGTSITIRNNIMKKDVYTKLINDGIDSECIQKAMHLISSTDYETLKEICLQLLSENETLPIVTTESKYKIIRKVIDADNSCLFNSIGYLVYGRDKFSTFNPMNYRKIVADVVLSDPSKYNTLILDNKTSQEYANWIIHSDKWGGEIELSILSSYLDIEIAVSDICNGTILIYNQSELGDKNRIYLLYDGIHYDSIINSNKINEITTFSNMDIDIMNQVTVLSNQLKQQKQYTNLASCCLQCNICYTFLRSENEARDHAKLTGHQNFGQVN